MNITGQAIYYRQRKWAATRGIKPDAKGYTQTVEENLFQPLTTGAQAEFGSGAGSEMEGKMRALHSSSALVCNVFDHWRSQLLLGQSLAALTTALGAPASIRQVQFEQIQPTGLRGIAPHLDVVLRGDESKPFFIESKFTEPYQPHSTEGTFTKSYFPDSGELWEKYGLTRCEALARRINANQEQFSRLNVPQLLKHILGIVNTSQKDFTLLYLWYDYPSSEAAEHRAEVETFMLRLNGGIDFRAMTYQGLFKGMQGDATVDSGYLAYLAERYFPG